MSRSAGGGCALSGRVPPTAIALCRARVAADTLEPGQRIALPDRQHDAAHTDVIAEGLTLVRLAETHRYHAVEFAPRARSRPAGAGHRPKSASVGIICDPESSAPCERSAGVIRADLKLPRVLSASRDVLRARGFRASSPRVVSPDPSLHLKNVGPSDIEATKTRVGIPSTNIAVPRRLVKTAVIGGRRVNHARTSPERWAGFRRAERARPSRRGSGATARGRRHRSPAHVRPS